MNRSLLLRMLGEVAYRAAYGGSRVTRTAQAYIITRLGSPRPFDVDRRRARTVGPAGSG